MKQLRAINKYFLSFSKSHWEFEDYPLETWINPDAAQEEIKYGAMFTNWLPFAVHGKTKSEAGICRLLIK